MKRLSVDSAQIVHQIRIKNSKKVQCTLIELSPIFYKAIPKQTIIAPTLKGFLDDFSLAMLPFSEETKVGMNA